MQLLKPHLPKAICTPARPVSQHRVQSGLPSGPVTSKKDDLLNDSYVVQQDFHVSCTGNRHHIPVDLLPNLSYRLACQTRGGGGDF